MEANNNGGRSSVRLNFAKLKLYGRDKEIYELRHALESVERSRKPEIVLLHGFSGTGKSTLANTLEDVVGRGYFLNGKYDQLRSPQPFSGIVEAFSRISVALSRRDDRDDIHNDVVTGLGRGYVHLTNIFPKLADLWKENSQKDTPKQEATTAKSWGFERTKAAVRDFICILSQKHSITTVLFLDDLQWADASSLDLIRFLLNDDKTEGLLFVGTYRDNEVDDSHPLAVRLRDIQHNSPFAIRKIKVGSLCVESINCLVAAATRTHDPTKTMELSNVVHKKTDGNAFFAIQFLKMLQDEGMLYWSSKSYQWEWNIDRIKGDTTMSDNAVTMVARKISKLSKWASGLLSVAACFGSYFHFDLVVAVIERDPKMKGCESELKPRLEDALKTVVSEGLVTHREGSSKYRFVHDKVQQGAYSLIDDETERLKLHVRTGYFLKHLYSRVESREEWMFLVFTDQLNRGSSLIVDVQERIDLAQQNLDAAMLVMGKSAFFPAAKYLKSGLAMLEGLDVWADHYKLGLDLYSTLAEVAFCVGDMQTCEGCCDVVLDSARNAEDRQHVSVVRIDCWGAQGRLIDAVEFGCDVFRETGQTFPRRLKGRHTLLALFKAKRLLWGKTNHDILAIPPMTDKKVLFALDVISMMAPMFFSLNRTAELHWISLWMLNVSLRYGLSVHSPRAFAMCGAGLGQVRKFKEATRYGKLSHDLADRFSNTWEPQATITRCISLDHLTRPIQQLLDPLLKAHQYGMESGDIHHASFCAASYCMMYFYSGLPLGPIAEDAEAFATQCDTYNQAVAAKVIRIIEQGSLNLMGRSTNRVTLTGVAMDQDEFLNGKYSDRAFCVFVLWELRVQLAFYFEDPAAGRQACQKLLDLGVHLAECSYRYPSVFMFCSLTAMQVWSTERKRRYRRIARVFARELAKWVGKKALNTQHKLLIVQAYSAALKKSANYDLVISKFNEAISASRKAGFTHDAALASELAGRYCLTHQDAENTHYYLMDAVELYGAWGAQAKVDLMMEDYSFLSSEDFTGAQGYSGVRGQSRFTRETTAKHANFDPFQFGKRLSSSMFRRMSATDNS